MLDFQAVGNNIHDLRVQNGYSQDALAELLGVSHQAVSRWELGLAAPSVDNLAELCDLFGVSFERLLLLDRKIEWDSRDIFKGHSRMFVIKKITDGEVDYDVVANFNSFLPQERRLILRAIKEGKLNVDRQKLALKLTQEEHIFMRGKK